jgi:uncharacterized NAD-dependent epimerase/dehydratase family protein
VREIAFPQPYLLFLGDAGDERHAKTAFGLRDWAPQHCVAEYALPGVAVSTGLPKATPSQARARGARSMIIGVACEGGAISRTWIPSLFEAVAAGLDIVSGMHTRLEEVPELEDTARRLGRRLINVRVPPPGLTVGTGRKRGGKRLLTVGTDCALGKKYTALVLARELSKRGVAADFRATGQTGIMIAGGGIAIDAVPADFVAGAAEALSPDAAPDHWDIVEGQGSLFHPSYAGVSLGLLHGTQPDVIVVCHEAGRVNVLGLEGYPLPDLPTTIDLNLRLARRTNPAVRCAGVSLNTSTLSEADALRLIAAEGARLGLPVADPMRAGAGLERLVASCLED